MPSHYYDDILQEPGMTTLERLQREKKLREQQALGPQQPRDPLIGQELEQSIAPSEATGLLNRRQPESELLQTPDIGSEIPQEEVIAQEAQGLTPEEEGQLQFAQLQQGQQGPTFGDFLIQAAQAQRGETPKLSTEFAGKTDALAQKNAAEMAFKLTHDPVYREQYEQALSRQRNRQKSPTSITAPTDDPGLVEEVPDVGLPSGEEAVDEFKIDGIRYTAAPTGKEDDWGDPEVSVDIHPEEKLRLKAEGAKITEQAKTEAKVETGKRAARRATSVVAMAIKGLNRVYAGSYKEGGAGSRAKQVQADVRLWLGGKQSRGLSKTSAYPGKKTEVITKFMPMLTMQGDKPGSVRLVSTVFNKLWGSYADLHHDPGPAREMSAESMKNMYGFAAAIQDSGSLDKFVENQGYTPEELQEMSPEELDMIAAAVTSDMLNISANLTPNQQKELDALVKDVSLPLDEILENEATGLTSRYKTGETRTIEGVTYKRNERGEWLPIDER